MLANRPRNDGLPKAPRSRSVAPPRQDEPFSNYSRESSSRYEGPSSFRQVQPQWSMASGMPPARDRSDPPHHPRSPQTSRPHNHSRAYELNRQEFNASSSSTASSNGSSLLDRLKSAGNTSSRTSLEEDYGPLRGGRGHNSKAIEDSRRLYQEHGHEEGSGTTAGVGYTIWSRLATAAGTLSVDVSKAWAVNVALASGEETPPGRESRLTQAMKAYHLEKARDPSDLPEWLFEEHERQPVGRSRFTANQNNRQDEYEDTVESRIPVSRSRGLQDIYNSAAVQPNVSSRASGKPNRNMPNRFDDELVTPSKATDRLKALRHAKRQNNRHDADAVKSSARADRRDGTGGTEILDTSPPPPRIGLPSGPGARARRY